MERSRPRAPIWCFVILLGMLILFYLPLGSMFVNSLKIKEGGWGLQWYQEVFEDRVLLEALGRSLWLGILTAVIASLLGLGAVLAMERSESGWMSKALEVLSVGSLVLPELVFALSLLSWFFILSLELSFFTLLVAHITFSVAYVMMAISARLKGISKSLEEAAMDLGASEWKILWRIKIPLLKTAILAGAILSFLLSFDDFLISFFTSGAGSDTLPIKLYGSMKMGLTPKLSALSVLMILISMGLMFVLWKLKGLRLAAGETEKN